MFKTVNGGKLPTRGTKYSACVDLYANEDLVIGAGETNLIGLGVAIDHEKILDGINSVYPYNEGMLPKYKYDHFLKTHYMQLMLRSSLGKKGLILPNGVGIIDLDFKDEIKMVIHNPLKLSKYYKSIKSKEYSEDMDMTNKVMIKKGDKIAQITLLGHKSYLFGIESDNERYGGFGSTDNAK